MEDLIITAGNSKPALKYVTEGQEFETTDQFKNGAALKIERGIPLDTDLYLSIDKPYEDELISNEKDVNLARPSTEYFFVKKKLKLKIQDTVYDWYKQWITRAEIIIVGKLDQNAEIFLANERPWVDMLVTSTSVIDLARPGVEHFYVKDADLGCLVTISVNGKPFNIKRGSYTGSKIKEIAGIAPGYLLNEEVGGELNPVADHAQVLIKGGEVFFSCPPDGASS
jgi:hypothetical protein